jgi:adenylate cyclase
MDGLSLLQKLQENEKQVSTIIVSAYGDMSNIRIAMNRGAFDFVSCLCRPSSAQSRRARCA